VSPIAKVDAFARRSIAMLWRGWYFLGGGGSRPSAIVAIAFDWLRRFVGDVSGDVIVIVVAVAVVAPRYGIVFVVPGVMIGGSGAAVTGKRVSRFAVESLSLETPARQG